MLNDPNVSARRGSALAIGVLLFKFLASRWRNVLLKLCGCCTIEENPEDTDAEAHVNAVKGLVAVCETLINGRTDSVTPLMEEDFSLFLLIKNEVMMTLFKALDDYSIDNRGDVGSWVRKAALDGLEKCTNMFYFPLFDENLATCLIGGIVKQAVEKMDKLREAAANVLYRILHNQMVYIPHIPFRDKLEEIVPKEADAKWAVPTYSYPRFVQLLQFGCYSRHLLSALVISIGGLQDSLKRVSLSALLDYLQGSINRQCMLSGDILWILQQYKKCDRVIVPTLKVYLQMVVGLSANGGLSESFTSSLQAPCEFIEPLKLQVVDEIYSAARQCQLDLFW
ncbi:hypothetical protein K1719_041248 [Acacia pycnantha]|nr:hypothetical protein K1719_041248 [Acacia pycnantha]